MKVGFTGTREGLTDQQLAWLYSLLEDQSPDMAITEVHHGACVGADLAVHQAALDANCLVHVWPPTNMSLCATECLIQGPLVTIHPRMPYFNRDREIVNATEGLIALPKHDAQPDPPQWGGTWYTVDFALRMNRPVIICNPKGIVTKLHSSSLH